MKARLAAAAAVAVIGVTAPSAMGAVTIASDRECIREGGSAKFVATGFQPNQPVAISLDGRQFATDTADAAGRVGGDLSNLPRPGRSEQRGALSITQTTNPAVTATKAFRETQVYVVTKPSGFKPGRRLRIRAGGFYGGGPTLYGHVRGPKKRNLRIGRVKGDCGKVSATKKVILKRGDPFGLYIVQFDTVRQFFGLRRALQLPCDPDTKGRAPFCLKAYRIRRRILRLGRVSSFSSPVFSGQARWEPDHASIR